MAPGALSSHSLVTDMAATEAPWIDTVFLDFLEAVDEPPRAKDWVLETAAHLRVCALIL